MALELFTVKIDMERLQARLGHATRGETLNWLKLAGITATCWPGVFVAERAALTGLETDEVVSVTPLGS